MTQIAIDTPTPSRGAFSMKVVIALVLVGIFSFSAFWTLSAFAPELMSGDDGRAHALSRSAVGYAAAARLVETQGKRVSVSRMAPDEHDTAALVVITPERPLEAVAFDTLTAQRTLIILPKWDVAPSQDIKGWVRRIGPMPEQAVVYPLEELAPDVHVARAQTPMRPRLHFDARAPIAREGVSFNAGEIQGMQSLYGQGITPVLVSEDGRIVLAQLKDRPIYILADPDFLNTQGLADVSTARAGMEILTMLSDEGETIVFDVTMNGFQRSRSLLRLMFEPPFLAATLSLFAVALLLAWRAFTRSAPTKQAKRAIALGKQALAENSAALIRLAHRQYRMTKGYAAMTAAELVDAFGLARADGAEATASLDRVAAAQGLQTYTELMREASDARNSEQSLAAARKLHLWKEEMLRATR